MKRSVTRGWLLFRSLICYLCAIVVGFVFFLPCMIIAAFSSPAQLLQNKLFFWLMDKVYRGVLGSFFLPLRIKGLEHITDEPAIVVANHESSLDILVVGGIFRGRVHLWYALRRFFTTPILGFLLRKMAIPVDQEQPLHAARSLVRGMACARSLGIHSVLFPEGGRYLDGKIHAFFSGFAMMARKLKQPVIPVMLRNLGATYPPGSFLIYPHTIHVIIGEPMMYRENETDESFSERVREWFVQQS